MAEPKKKREEQVPGELVGGDPFKGDVTEPAHTEATPLKPIKPDKTGE